MSQSFRYGAVSILAPWAFQGTLRHSAFIQADSHNSTITSGNSERDEAAIQNSGNFSGNLLHPVRTGPEGPPTDRIDYNTDF